MSRRHEELLAAIARRQGLDIGQVRARVQARQARSRGLLGRGAAARSLVLSYALERGGQRLSAFLAAGSRHVSGRSLDDALRAARGEATRGLLTTLGYWPPSGQAPDELARHYVAAVEAIGAAGIDASVSIKVDLMDYREELLDAVLRAAAAHGVRVHFDAQGLETADRTHALVEASLARGAAVSATLPARWQRSAADAERFIAWRVPVRLVKGQGGDPSQPRADPRRCFLELVERLAGRAVHVGVATHDRRTAEPALHKLLARGTPCSLEQLRSLPRLDAVAQAAGVPVRAYVAYGRFGLPYAVGEVFRRPAIAAWVLRDLLVRHRSGTSAAGDLG
jgi:proline dehydrogenase